MHLILCKKSMYNLCFLGGVNMRVYKRIIGSCAALVWLAGGVTLENHILFIFVNLFN